MLEIIKYQEIDAKIRKIESDLASSNNRKGATDMQQYLKDSQVRLMKIDEVAKNLTEQYQKAKKLYDEFITKLEALSKSVEQADKEKASQLESTIANFISTSEALDNNLAVLQNKISNLNKEFEAVFNNSKKARKNLEIYKASYNAEREKVEPELKKLIEEKNKQKAKVDPKLLAKYNSKSESKIFPIFVPEVKGRCGGCRMEIPAGKLSDLNNKGLIECENCSRVIYKA